MFELDDRQVPAAFEEGDMQLDPCTGLAADRRLG